MATMLYSYSHSSRIVQFKTNGLTLYIKYNYSKPPVLDNFPNYILAHCSQQTVLFLTSLTFMSEYPSCAQQSAC